MAESDYFDNLLAVNSTNITKRTMTNGEGPDPEILLQLVSMKMPFGKYKGTLLCDLPDFYLAWFKKQGFPKGKLGVLLETIFEIKSNGLTFLLDPLKKGGRFPNH